MQVYESETYILCSIMFIVLFNFGILNETLVKRVVLTCGPDIFDKHCGEAECYHVGYCQYKDAWTVWFSCKGKDSEFLDGSIDTLFFCTIQKLKLSYGEMV